MTINSIFKRIVLTRNLMLELFFNLFPVKRDLVVFYSFNGQYNDNPRYISERLHEANPNVKIAWILNENSMGTQPEYVIPVRHDSVKRYYYSSVASVYVDNYIGKHAFRKNKKVSPILRALKKKGQLNISTWHGTPLKKIHNDIKGAPVSKEGCFTTCDLFISGNEHLSQVVSAGLCGNINVLNVGSPRNDLLVNQDDDLAKEIKRKNGFSEDTRIVLYAPTFRDSVLDSGIKQMELLDIPALLKALSDRLGGQWKLALRTHPGVFTQLKQYYGDFLENHGVLDANQFPEMAEYLLITDVLITDYSGSLFDYCLTDRPCFLFAHDLENYSKKERGLYINIEDLPFTFSNSCEELLENIRNYNADSQKEKVKVFMDRIRNCESGKASEIAAEKILEKLKVGN